VEPGQDPHKPELPRPTVWPIGFAIGVACLLVGLVVRSWPAVGIGGAIAVVFGFLWVRDLTAGARHEPEAAPAPAEAQPPAAPGEPARFPRSKLLEASTLGLGAVIGGVVTVPPLFVALIPPFLKQSRDEVDLGPVEAYPEGEFVVTTFLERPEHGEVSRRTAFVRYNGLLEGEPSFTIISNRCVHLGCPTQPNGPLFDERQETVKTKNGQQVTLIPSQPAGFGCPCHGGAYDTEGNRTAGPPVRAMDRYEFAIRNGRLLLGDAYSVSQVDGAGANAKIHKYKIADPGNHVDGWEQIFYPIQPQP